MLVSPLRLLYFNSHPVAYYTSVDNFDKGNKDAVASKNILKHLRMYYSIKYNYENMILFLNNYSIDQKR